MNCRAVQLLHTLLCRRLTPEQSKASAEALISIPPDNAFLTDMIKLWWQEPLPQPTCASDVAQQMQSLATEVRCPIASAYQIAN